MEATPQEPITPEAIQVRQVTHYQTSWVESEAGAPGMFSVQLILDQGAAEYVIRPTADDLDVLRELLDSGQEVYFDLSRKVLMFGNESVGD
jgi:hypothetical protein